MITVSVCMIVKDEEDTLERCLTCARQIADEIIIVDTGSTDDTKRIAARFTDRVYDFEWIDDFSAARNFSFAQATKEYLMWLDADDVLLPADIEALNALKRTLDPRVDAVMMRYNTGFDQHGNVTFSYMRERLIRAAAGFKWQDPVHEYLAIGGNIIESDICITHAKQPSPPSGRNLRIYRAQLEKGNSLSPRGMYYFARELKDNAQYDEAIEQFTRFLDDGRGWVEDNIAACSELARCCQLTGRPKEAFSALLRSFSYDLPRGEICCQIGYHFKNQRVWRLAAFWFELALRLEKPEKSWGFIQHDYWGYIPALECAVCYDHLGEYEKARAFNERAASFKPDSTAVAYNRAYFSRRGTESNAAP